MKAFLLILFSLVVMVGCRPVELQPKPEAITPTIYSQEQFATQTALVAVTPTSSPAGPSVSPASTITPTPESTSQHGDSFSPNMSADGRYVAFTSRSGDLVQGEPVLCPRPDGSRVNCTQVYIYDRQGGVMTLVSAASDGAPGNGSSDQPDISADGRWIVFRSDASNLGSGTASAGNLYVRDLKTGTLERLAIDRTGSEPTISADGRLVAFNASQEHSDIFIYDRQTHLVKKVSTAYGGGDSDGDSFAAQISEDGRWVAFWSWAGNLVRDDTEKCRESQTNTSCGDVFLYDLESKQIRRISVGEDYGLGMGYYHISLSGDGELMLFSCSIFNRRSNQFTCGRGEGECCGKISADGRWIAYGGVDFYLRSLATGIEKLVSVSSEGTRGNGELIDFAISTEGESFEPGFTISADGRWVAFASTASNLAPGDTFICSDAFFPPHNCYDIFVHDRETGVTEWISKPLHLNSQP